MISPDGFLVIITLLMTAYPQFEGSLETSKYGLWYECLKDIDEAVLTCAVKQHIMSSPFPPSISELRKRAFDLILPPARPATVAWDTLMRALESAGSINSTKAWAALDATTKEIVGGYHTFIAWSNMSRDQLESFQRTSFIKCYEQLTLKQRQNGSLPDNYRVTIGTDADEENLVEQSNPATGNIESDSEKIQAPKAVINNVYLRLTGKQKYTE